MADPGQDRRRDGWRDGDGALRGLVGAGRSKLSPSAAMRARDVAHPDAEDLAQAERLIAERLRGRAGADRPGLDRAASDGARTARPGGRPSPGWLIRRGQPAPRDRPTSRDRPAPRDQPMPPGPASGQTAGGAGAPEGTGGSSPVRS